MVRTDNRLVDLQPGSGYCAAADRSPETQAGKPHLETGLV